LVLDWNFCLVFGLKVNFYIKPKTRANACRQFKNLCKLGLRPNFFSELSLIFSLNSGSTLYCCACSTRYCHRTWHSLEIHYEVVHHLPVEFSGSLHKAAD